MVFLFSGRRIWRQIKEDGLKNIDNIDGWNSVSVTEALVPKN